jgi:uncharacterized protein YkwD
MRHAAVVLLVIFTLPIAQGQAPRDETRLTLRHDVLRLINRDRASHNLPPVELDVQVSALADAYCTAQIRNRTTGHFTTDGLAPYMRYSFGGGNDGVSENAAAWSAPYAFSNHALVDMARRSQQTMMAERAPNDGHRRTILDPHATHVGIGLAWEGGEFRMAQEFIRRYVDWKRPLPRSASLYEPVTGWGKPRAGFRVEAITVHHEPVPESMPAHVANALSTYRLPDKRRDYLPRLKSYVRRQHDGSFHLVREEYSDGRNGDFTVTDDGTFHFTVPFRDGAGVYTVVVWVTRDNDRKAIAASNISIRVDRPPQSAYRGAASSR